MQPLLDGPRRGLTEAQVRGLLQSDSAIQITFGAEALDDSFAVISDISDYLSAGEIDSDANSTVQRVCSLTLDADVTDSGWSYLSGFVKPYQTFTDLATGVSARFYLGVYTLTTPKRTLGTTPASLQFQGYDLCYLLRQQIGDSYEVAAGEDPATAAATVIGLAIPEVEVIVTPSGSTLDQPLSWPFDGEHPVTFLEVVETLLASIGYRQVWVDWNGSFRIEPFIDLQDASFEWTFDASASDNIVAEETTQDIDIFTVPNWWRFVMADLTDVPEEGVTMFTYTDASPLNPGSTVNRGRVIRKIVEVKAATYGDLVAFAQRQIAADMTPAETFEAKTQPFPLAWHLDVIHFQNESLGDALPLSPGGARRVVSTTWKLPLDGSDMDWTWQTITDQSAALGLTVVEV